MHICNNAYILLAREYWHNLLLTSQARTLSHSSDVDFSNALILVVLVSEQEFPISFILEGIHHLLFNWEFDDTYNLASVK